MTNNNKQNNSKNWITLDIRVGHPYFMQVHKLTSCSLFRWLFTEVMCMCYAFCGVLFGICSLSNLTILSCVCWLKVCCPNYGKTCLCKYFMEGIMFMYLFTYLWNKWDDLRSASHNHKKKSLKLKLSLNYWSKDFYMKCGWWRHLWLQDMSSCWPNASCDDALSFPMAVWELSCSL